VTLTGSSEAGSKVGGGGRGGTEEDGAGARRVGRVHRAWRTRTWPRRRRSRPRRASRTRGRAASRPSGSWWRAGRGRVHAALRGAGAAYPVGDPTDRANKMGPLAGWTCATPIEDQLARSLAAGATVEAAASECRGRATSSSRRWWGT
jgi:hypothetical protein